jgi:hypothetical protein
VWSARRRSSCERARILFATDPIKHCGQQLEKVWGPMCLHVEVGAAIKGGRVVRIRPQITNGQPWQLEKVLAHCKDSEKPTTSYIERLNLFIRRSLSFLRRRTNSMARLHEKLDETITLLQCYYNFVLTHSALPQKSNRDMITPAEQAESQRAGTH